MNNIRLKNGGYLSAPGTSIEVDETVAVENRSVLNIDGARVVLLPNTKKAWGRPWWSRQAPLVLKVTQASIVSARDIEVDVSKFRYTGFWGWLLPVRKDAAYL
jgi:hypothetical protein